MGMVYHYTTIDKFESILKSKSIWFNRLDRVDDKEEYIYGSSELDLKLSKYIFITSWTKNPKENSWLWEKYTDNKGVRIGFHCIPFEMYTVGKINYYFKEMYHIQDDCVIPFNQNEIQLYDVKYVDNPEQRIRNAASYDEEWLGMRIKELGIYKRRSLWEKQGESRFKLISYPFSPADINKIESDLPVDNIIGLNKSMIEQIIIGKPITPNYIPIKLRKSALERIEVTMGPECTKEDRKRVMGLLGLNPINSLYSKKIVKPSSLGAKSLNTEK